MIVVTRVKDKLRISAPYEARELIKQIPGRKWDPALKLWTCPATSESVARIVLGQWPGGVHWDTTPSKPPTPLTDWPGAMFAALPSGLRKPAYRALSRVLHPDTGGDTEQMQLLNNAWNKTGAFS